MNNNYFEYEELLMELFGISDNDYEKTDFDDLLFDKFEISFEQFCNIADLLVTLTPVHASDLTGKRYQGFVSQEKGIVFLKKEIVE